MLMGLAKIRIVLWAVGSASNWQGGTVPSSQALPLHSPPPVLKICSSYTTLFYYTVTPQIMLGTDLFNGTIKVTVFKGSLISLQQLNYCLVFNVCSFTTFIFVKKGIEIGGGQELSILAFGTWRKAAFVYYSRSLSELTLYVEYWTQKKEK